MKRTLAISAACLVLPGLIFTAFGQTQMEMNQDADRRFHAADKILNQVYQEMVAQQDKAGKEKLRTAQKAWVAFRDGQADFEADQYRGGTIVPLIHANCATRLTEARTAEFKAYLKERKEQ